MEEKLSVLFRVHSQGSMGSLYPAISNTMGPETRMSAVFVHLSDIHFGQERDQRIYIHNDVKEQLIDDARHVVRTELGTEASGILVTGDIAQAGIRPQYEVAGQWLDRLAAEIGCPVNRVQMVPGNHDLDRNKLSEGAKHLLGLIRAGGPDEYERIISNPVDRYALLARFEDYSDFCFGYQCALGEEARYAADLHVELVPGRSIRFVRMNSALLCSGDENAEQPELMIGERQFIFPPVAGEENVVLVHHPLSWCKDSEAVTEYVEARARVFIFGHEHDPKVDVREGADGGHLLTLAAGATVPFKSNEEWTFTYNVLQFDWGHEDDTLVVTIHPRTWSIRDKRFEADERRLGGKSPCFRLNAPNFRRAPKPLTQMVSAQEYGAAAEADPVIELVPSDSGEVEKGETVIMSPPVEGYDLVMMHFFRDLYEGERLRILMALDAVPSDSNEKMTRSVERKLLGWLAKQGKLSEVERMMSELIAARKDGAA